ncbi:AraC-like DNA-binding protein [Kribbella aluminosa]|uniref:AraC-like DNA-binding protein n=1 Tax=Kribbella aluminosa TaxID=416017 RepID=A0ABS4UFT7_9ACTN|nr:helix-turn-helix domain-containing protein [Kribbella aluminosa]MBP2350426.1 AraC-like DNA-binding protein [Kribbella aluminosa]
MHPWIETVALTPTTTPITVLPPDPATTVVWRMTPAGDSDVLVAGPRTTAAYHTTKDLPVCVRLRIRPGGVIPLLGTPPDQLVDEVVPLHDLCGQTAVDLAAHLVTYRDHLERAAEELGAYLVARIPPRLPAQLNLVNEAAAALAPPPAGPSPASGVLAAGRTTALVRGVDGVRVGGGDAALVRGMDGVRVGRGSAALGRGGEAVLVGAGWRVGETAARLGVSERYLRRVFRQAVGVSPKHFARIARVRRVIGTHHSWADTAAYAGYTDQSHLIADFRALMHVTPNAYTAGNVPLSNC